MANLITLSLVLLYFVAQELTLVSGADLTCFVTPPVRDLKSAKTVDLLAVRAEADEDATMTFSSRENGEVYSDGRFVEFGETTGVPVLGTDGFNLIIQSATLSEPEEEYKKPFRFGVHYCDQITTAGSLSRAPLLIYNQIDLIPADGIRTHVFSVDDTLELCVDPNIPKTWKGPIEWAFNGKQPSWLKGFSGSKCIKIKHLQTCQAGIYEAYRRLCGRREKQHAFFDVRVRRCPDGFYDPPACTTPCTVDCFTGYCGDDGQCVCPNGFMGSLCETALEGRFGNVLDATFSSVGLATTGQGSLICTERSGCSCPSGWKGIGCMEACDSMSFGPDCAYPCPMEAECNRFTGGSLSMDGNL